MKILVTYSGSSGLTAAVAERIGKGIIRTWGDRDGSSHERRDYSDWL